MNPSSQTNPETVQPSPDVLRVVVDANITLEPFYFMEWISVEKNLPDSDAPVLVAAGEQMALAYWDAVEGRFRMMSRDDHRRHG